ncbi:MAG: hypothetical protein EOP45_08800 [Sphingobacteriaceae bacterium]|nr:MAG: hypothetical protein EOP45_08800 [Sphingobacteriaceae bacterium]
MSDTEMIYNFFYRPNRVWNIPANTDTIIPSAGWDCVNSSFPEINAEQKSVFMPDDTGTFVVPYDCTFQAVFDIDVLNDLEFSGTGKVSLVYIPKNPASQSSQYTIASFDLTSTVTSGVVSNNFQANTGDIINIVWNLSSAVNIDLTDKICNTGITITNLPATNPSTQFYYGKSGYPPALSQLDANSIMISTPIVNNVATFNVTFDGTATGAPIFSKRISTTTIEVQLKGSQDTTLTPPARSYLLPYPADHKTVTVVFAAANVSQGTWIANALIQGV